MNIRTAPTSRRLVYASLAGAILCFSSVLLFTKHFTAYLDVWMVNGLRYSIAALIWLRAESRISSLSPKP